MISIFQIMVTVSIFLQSPKEETTMSLYIEVDYLQ